MKTISCITLATIITMAMMLQGCTFGGAMGNLVKYTPVAISAFAGVVAIINPPAGSALAMGATAANAALATLQAAVTAYNNAPASEKTTALGKVNIALEAVLSNLGTFLTSIPPSQQYTAQATAALELLIATLQAIQATLPTTSTATATVKSNAVPNGVKPAKSVREFKSRYNAIMGPAHAI